AATALPQWEVPAPEAVPEDPPELAEGGVGVDGPEGGGHDADAVPTGAGHLLEGPLDGLGVAAPPHLPEPGDLGLEGAGGKFEGLDRRVASLAVDAQVDAHHQPGSVFQGPLVGEGPLRQLLMYPGLLGGGHEAAQGVDPSDELGDPLADGVGQVLDEVAA